MLHKHRMEKTPSKTGLTHEITIVRGQGRQGAYVEDRNIRVLGVEIPSVSLLPRRDKYTRVYTTVYPRVHNSIHVCTLPRSKYILCRACLYVCFLGIMPRIFSDGIRLSGIRNDIPKDPKAGLCERDHASALPSKRVTLIFHPRERKLQKLQNLSCIWSELDILEE